MTARKSLPVLPERSLGGRMSALELLASPITRDNQWTCRLCGCVSVVASLARQCEQRDLEVLS